MAKEVSSSASILDSREIEARINDLESEISDLKDEIEEAEDDLIKLQSVESEEAEDEREDLKENIAEKRDELAELEEELKPLQELREEVGHPDWPHGLTLINEDYWREYAEDLASDIHGNAIREAAWPFDCIDWEKAADALQMDYSQAEYDGVTFYYHS